MAFDSHIDRVTPIKCNMDVECMLDMQNGKGIRIRNVDAFEKKPDKHTKKHMKTLSWAGPGASSIHTQTNRATALRK